MSKARLLRVIKHKVLQISNNLFRRKINNQLYYAIEKHADGKQINTATRKTDTVSAGYNKARLHFSDQMSLDSTNTDSGIHPTIS